MEADEEETRHLSPDSSTQAVQRKKHRHGKKKKYKHKSKKRKRKHSDVDDEDTDYEKKSASSNDSSSHSDDDAKEYIDDELVLDIKPLTEYIEDRKELNNELFKIIGRKEMKKLLPKSIKKLDVDELKSRCLDQLEVISKKRLLKIINGQEMSSSSSASESEAGTEPSSLQNSVQQNIADVPWNPAASPEIQERQVNILEQLSGIPDQDEIDELVDGVSKDNYKESAAAESRDDPSDTVVDTESQLLELEYRARALKSMVKAQQSERVST